MRQVPGVKEMIFNRLQILMLHIPDGFLSPVVSLLGWLAAGLFVGLALRKTKGRIGERQVPLLGVMAAFIFAAQAINFPVAGGTSGHLIGGALAAIVLGPWPAVLVMTAVVALQGLLFQDGGLLVMGWNIFNMGIVTTFIGAAVYGLFRPNSNRGRIIAGGAVAAWVSVEAAAMATAIELAASGTVPLQIGLVAMTGVHALIGIGEAIITVGALLLILGVRPDIVVREAAGPRLASTRWVAAGLLLALFVAVFSFAASPFPDGLERVAEDQGFILKALDPVYQILPDYTIPAIENGITSGIAAVVLGTVVVFGVALLTGRLIQRVKRVPEESG
jgi:cobalt/nickel transport system permease protein